MRGDRLHLCLLTNVIVFVSVIVRTLTYTIPDATVELIKPKGFRLSIPHENGITDVSFNIKIDQRITLYQPGDFAAIINERTGDVWAYDNINTKVKPGNVINYWVHVQFGKLGKNYREIGLATVSASSVEISTYCPETGQRTIQDCPAESDCELSATTVGGKRVCKGQLIFEDNFDKLDNKTWLREVRIQSSEEGSPFVSFQNREATLEIQKGRLYIKARLLSEFYHFNLPSTRNSELNLEEECTAILNKAEECKRQAQYSQVLPPIISAQIRTKNSFSFRFGKVKIRALLPQGDWLFPLILLEPLENYYGATGYASGQIRIAFNRGNEMLVDDKGKNISNSWLAGGVVMTSDEKARNTHLRWTNTKIDLSGGYHIYSLTWTEDKLTLEFDDKPYAVFNENFLDLHRRYHGHTISEHKMAPFDREFFLTLGLSAGGHHEFPDGCRTGPELTLKPWQNGDPKAELQFLKDKDNWYSSWDTANVLAVDYVKVYAL